MTSEVRWAIEPHCCKICLGRILFDGTNHRCSNCGATTSEGHKALCCCGATLKSGKDARLRCVVNTKRDASFPGEVCVESV